MRNLVIAVALIGLFATAANAETTAWKWTTEDGVVSFTDEEKYVPAKYKDSAEQVTLGALADYERFTPVTVSPASAEEAPAETPAGTTINNTTINATTVTAAPDCGTVTLRSERRQVGEYNRRFFIAEDDCGVLYDSPVYPDFQIDR